MRTGCRIVKATMNEKTRPTESDPPSSSLGEVDSSPDLAGGIAPDSGGEVLENVQVFRPDREEVQIPEDFALCLKTILGDAKTVITDSRDSEIPTSLRQYAEESAPTPQTDKVVTVRCHAGLSVLVITEPSKLEEI
jgi:hypothetical protein